MSIRTLEIMSHSEEAAVKSALVHLNVPKDEIRVNVLRQPSKGIFGIIGRKEGIYEIVVVGKESDIKRLESIKEYINKSAKEIKLNIDIVEEFKSNLEKLMILKFNKNNELYIENSYDDLVYLNNEDKLNYLNDTLSILENLKQSQCFKDIPLIVDDLASISRTKQLESEECCRFCTSYYQLIKSMEKYCNERFELLKNMKSSIEIGLKGEKEVDEYLNLYDFEWTNLSNIRLEVDGRSIENDNIIICDKGIFVLEVKNIGTSGNFSIRIEKDGRWTRVFQNGTTEAIEYDATTQNDRHTAILKKFLNSKLNRNLGDDDYINVHGIVVIANNKLPIDNQSTQPVYRVSEAYRYINTFENKLSLNDIENIKDLILSNNLEPIKYGISNYKREIEENVKLFEKLLEIKNIVEY